MIVRTGGGKPGLKWGKYEGKDILPLWVADMDFRAPPAVMQTAKKKQNTEIMDTQRHIKVLSIRWFVTANRSMAGKLTPTGWSGCQAWSVLSMFAAECSREKRGRLLPMFQFTPRFFRLPVISIFLVPTFHSNWKVSFYMDFQRMENTPTQPGDLFMLCHPHNPVGTAFTREELERFSKWARERAACYLLR